MVATYHEHMAMDDVMRHWPATVRVLLKHQLLCVGCPVASFHSVEEAIREHGIDGTLFRSDLRAAIAAAGQLSRDRPSASTIRR